jgi:hypothetical protein
MLTRTIREVLSPTGIITLYCLLCGAWICALQSAYQQSAWTYLVGLNIAGVVFEESCMRAVLQLPLFATLPWPAKAVELKTREVSSSRETSANFTFELIAWKDFATKASKCWSKWWAEAAEKKITDIKQKNWEKSIKEDDCPLISLTWANVHISDGGHPSSPVEVECTFGVVHMFSQPKLHHTLHLSTNWHVIRLLC